MNFRYSASGLAHTQVLLCSPKHTDTHTEQGRTGQKSLSVRFSYVRDDGLVPFRLNTTNVIFPTSKIKCGLSVRAPSIKGIWNNKSYRLHTETFEIHVWWIRRLTMYDPCFTATDRNVAKSCLDMDRVVVLKLLKALGN